MKKKIFSTAIVLILVNGCVGTIKIAEDESSASGKNNTPVYTKPIEEPNSSI